MRLRDKRKSQLRELGRSGTTVKFLALLWEARMNPVDAWEKEFAESYLMNRSRMANPLETKEQSERTHEEEEDPFA